MSISPDIGQGPAKNWYVHWSHGRKFGHLPYVSFTGSIHIAGQSQSLRVRLSEKISGGGDLKARLTLSESLRVQ